MIIYDKQYYFNTFIQLKYSNIINNINNNDIILDAFDIFNNKFYLLIDVNNFDFNLFCKLDKLYIKFNYEKNIKTNFIDKDKLFKTDKFKKLHYLVKKNKLIYKKLFFTDKFIKLKIIQPHIIKFFQSNITSKSHKKIILIERILSSNIDKNNFNNFSGERRIIFNHYELQQKLAKKYGERFLNVSLDNINIFQSFNIFNNADIIIGQHGAGLSNIFFMHKHKTLIEICPDWNKFNNWFKNLADFCQLKYIPINQPFMTKKQWYEFSTKYNIDYNVPDSVFNQTQYPNNFDNNNAFINQQKFKEDPFITFIKNSGSVDIDLIIKNIDLIIL
jgi:hypothetical protein